jgi:membrane dipeptidase
VTMPIFDSHLDLAANALMLDRDLSLPLDELAAWERGMTDLPYRTRPTVSIPELHRANVRLCSATVLARVRPASRPSTGFARSDVDHSTGEAAHAMGMAQIAYYDTLVRRGDLAMIRTAEELVAFTEEWALRPGAPSAESAGPTGSVTPPIGCILSMEGADPILTPSETGLWWDRGLRFASLVHYGEGRYAGGTGSSSGVTAAGFQLLRELERYGILLDLTHLSEPAFYEAIDAFSGAVLASHNNCRRLVPGDRQFSDEQIRLVAERGGVIGVACDAWMLYPGWERGVTRPEVVSLDAVADHIDHICDVTGSSVHAAIGSDLDGLYGWEQTPHDLKSVADLQNLIGLFERRGYQAEHIEGIMYRNWLQFFRRYLPTHGG